MATPGWRWPCDGRGCPVAVEALPGNPTDPSTRDAQITRVRDRFRLFDERNLAEISSPLYPDERLVVCRNPALATERAAKREELLAATERELDLNRA